MVPSKEPNKVGQPMAEALEGRGLTKGNSRGQNTRWTQIRVGVPSALERVREDWPEARFDATTRGKSPVR